MSRELLREAFMKLQIRIDKQPLLNQLAELGMERRGPYMVSLALNRLAKAVQKGLQKDITDNLTMNKEAWIKKQVSVRTGTWASPTRLVVRVELLDTASFLAGFEYGQEHLPSKGKFMVLPQKKVFGKTGIVGPDNPLRIKALAFHTTPHGLEGSQRTFVLHTVNNTPLVMQRIGPDDKGRARRGIKRSTNMRVLYAMIKHSHRDKKIHWVDTSSNTVRTETGPIFAEVIRYAIASARPK